MCVFFAEFIEINMFRRNWTPLRTCVFLAELAEISNYKNSSVIYESPHKILKTLSDLHQICPNRNIVVVKELTKLHEANYRGNIQTVLDEISSSKIKGEFVIILDGKK